MEDKLESLIKELNLKLDFKQIQRELFSLYFGEGWVNKFDNMFIPKINDDIQKVLFLYQNVDGSPKIREDLFPSDSTLIYDCFKQVPYEKVKYVINSYRPDSIIMLFSSKELEHFYNQGVLFLPDLLTVNKEGVEINDEHLIWTKITDPIKAELSDKQIKRFDSFCTRESVINSLKELGISCQED
jgi:uracil DNA glycosylase